MRRSSLRMSMAGVLLAAFAQEPVVEKRIQPVPASSVQEFRQQERVAVVVGVAAYPPESSLAPLRYANADAQSVADALRRQGYAVRLMLDQQATASYVRKAVADAARLINPGDGTLLFYFSGHGFASETKANYLATYGATADNIVQDGLSMEEVQRILDQSRARRRVMWVDACRNDASGKSASARSFAELNAAAGLRILLSTRFGDTSHESSELAQGVFTHFLLRGLRGEAAGTDGLITFEDLSRYVTQSVKRWGFERGLSQIPVERGEEVTGDFLIGSAASTPASSVVSPPKTPETISRPAASAPRAAYTGADPLGIDGTTVGLGRNSYSIEKEIEAGKQLSGEVERQAKIIQDPVIAEYLNRIGQILVRNSFSKVPFTIKALDSEEINAFPLPGGFLFVNTGLIRRARTEAELAGILAHLIAHVDARHGTRQLTKGSIFGLGKPSLVPNIQGSVAIPLGLLKFPRDFETEADRLALDYLAKSLYRPAGLLDFSENIESVEKQKPGSIAKIFESHRMTADRLAAAQKLIAQLGAPPDATVNTVEFDEIKLRLASLH